MAVTGSAVLKKLTELEIRYRVALENSKQLLYDLNLKTGRIVWSGNISSVAGYSPAEFIDCDLARWEKLIHPDDRKLAAKLLAKAIKTRTKYHIEYRFRRKNGQYAFIEDAGVLVDKQRMVGTMNDVSQLKEKINQLERFNDLMVGRELKMVELKEKIRALTGKAKAASKAKRRSWSDKFKEAVAMEEDVIWQLNDTYRQSN